MYIKLPINNKYYSTYLYYLNTIILDLRHVLRNDIFRSRHKKSPEKLRENDRYFHTSKTCWKKNIVKNVLSYFHKIDVHHLYFCMHYSVICRGTIRTKRRMKINCRMNFRARHFRQTETVIRHSVLSSPFSCEKITSCLEIVHHVVMSDVMSYDISVKILR